MKSDMTAKPQMDSESDEPGEWEIKDAADTLTKAEEIKKNKKLMPHVHKHLQKKVKMITSIAGLREKASEMNKPDSD